MARFFKNNKIVWLQNALEMVSITQLLFVLFLALGIKYLMDWSYKKALVKTSIIYGISFSIWMCFDLLMELNFNH